MSLPFKLVATLVRKPIKGSGSAAQDSDRPGPNPVQDEYRASMPPASRSYRPSLPPVSENYTPHVADRARGTVTVVSAAGSEYEKSLSGPLVSRPRRVA